MYFHIFLLTVLSSTVFFSSSVKAGCNYYAIAARCNNLNGSFPSDIPSRIQEIEASGSSDNVMNKLAKDDLKSLPNLKKLDLSGAKLREIAADTFENNRNMTELKFFDNELSTIEEGTFSNMSMIETLDLSSNRLSSLPDDVFTNSAVKFLAMSGNNFSSIPTAALSPLKSSLQRFEFSDSKSDIIIIRKGDFSGFTHLKTLHLPYCGIKTIEEGAFNGLDFGEDGLVVSRNPYNCSCDILPFYRWAKKELSDSRFIELKCEYPFKRSFSKLGVNDFKGCSNLNITDFDPNNSVKYWAASVWVMLPLAFFAVLCNYL